ncbi:hypothetical protein HYH03_012342 [Edaphochlamys debaryana]|uniref:Uncharacterized protein n=1 Tax=Edaphochlamys debaryana TaxID=47281 RepID=A0A836BU27_9CHLO|nr:hypothetical protein HYH03_012342 [Edaphochlamys debaryana]|eukprot:KAG2489116.1 hypothetical protein HYH03_012342 [Edaphochlamys debaryana]
MDSCASDPQAAVARQRLMLDCGMRGIGSSTVVQGHGVLSGCSLPLPDCPRGPAAAVWLDPEDARLAEGACDSDDETSGRPSDQGLAAGSSTCGAAGSDLRGDTCGSLPSAPPPPAVGRDEAGKAVQQQQQHPLGALSGPRRPASARAELQPEKGQPSGSGRSCTLALLAVVAARVANGEASESTSCNGPRGALVGPRPSSAPGSTRAAARSPRAAASGLPAAVGAAWRTAAPAVAAGSTTSTSGEPTFSPRDGSGAAVGACSDAVSPPSAAVGPCGGGRHPTDGVTAPEPPAKRPCVESATSPRSPRAWASTGVAALPASEPPSAAVPQRMQERTLPRSQDALLACAAASPPPTPPCAVSTTPPASPLTPLPGFVTPATSGGVAASGQGLAVPLLVPRCGSAAAASTPGCVQGMPFPSYASAASMALALAYGGNPYGAVPADWQTVRGPAPPCRCAACGGGSGGGAPPGAGVGGLSPTPSLPGCCSADLGSSGGPLPAAQAAGASLPSGPHPQAVGPALYRPALPAALPAVPQQLPPGCPAGCPGCPPPAQAAPLVLAPAPHPWPQGFAASVPPPPPAPAGPGASAPAWASLHPPNPFALRPHHPTPQPIAYPPAQGFAPGPGTQGAAPSQSPGLQLSPPHHAPMTVPPLRWFAASYGGAPPSSNGAGAGPAPMDVDSAASPRLSRYEPASLPQPRCPHAARLYAKLNAAPGFGAATRPLSRSEGGAGGAGYGPPPQPISPAPTLSSGLGPGSLPAQAPPPGPAGLAQPWRKAAHLPPPGAPGSADPPLLRSCQSAPLATVLAAAGLAPPHQAAPRPALSPIAASPLGSPRTAQPPPAPAAPPKATAPAAAGQAPASKAVVPGNGGPPAPPPGPPQPAERAPPAEAVAAATRFLSALVDSLRTKPSRQAVAPAAAAASASVSTAAAAPKAPLPMPAAEGPSVATGAAKAAHPGPMTRGPALPGRSAAPPSSTAVGVPQWARASAAQQACKRSGSVPPPNAPSPVPVPAGMCLCPQCRPAAGPPGPR